MNSRMWLVILIVFLSFPVVYIVGMLLYAHFTAFRPDAYMQTTISNASSTLDTIELPDTLTVYSWNIGYAGLGKESDFFYDGGRTVTEKKEIVEKNFHGIIQTVLDWRKDADFILLQEVDQQSKRSHGMNQLGHITETMARYGMPYAVFTPNYDVRFVPVPWTRPMGRVYSGLLSIMRYSPEMAMRHQLPSSFGWPKQLFMLNRCLSVKSFPYKNHQFLLVHLHLSAFDGGSLKQKEMEYLKQFLLEAEAAGHYVVVGGDWNQTPPGYQSRRVAKYEEQAIPEGFPGPGWYWAADVTQPTNRKVDTPYIRGATHLTVFDFFLISPNVECLEIETISLDFSYSDHEPVRMRFRLD